MLTAPDGSESEELKQEEKKSNYLTQQSYPKCDLGQKTNTKYTFKFSSYESSAFTLRCVPKNLGKEMSKG